MSIIDKIFNYNEDYRYKTWRIFGIKFSVVKKYNSKKINIYEEIKKHDIISFDIFDTLLIRPYVKPTDLFLHIEKLYKIKGFHKNRILAEKSARGKYIDKEEVTLNQIYEEIDEKYKRFKEIEIELEERILTTHKENKEIYDYALRIGKKIIIVSDMYLPKNAIEKILIKNNYTNYYKLYLYSDLMLTKDSSNLYKYIIDDLKVEPSSIMHIGDNFHSDFNNPKLYGINSVYIEKIIDTFLQNNIRARNLLYRHQNNIGVSIMLGLFALNCFNKSDNENKDKYKNYWRNFGFVYGGPAVFSYMNWLKKQIIKEDIKEVLFVARDGYSLKKVFDIIKPEYIKTHYICAPRIIYYLIALDFKYYNLGDSVKSVLEYYKDKDEYLQKNTPNINSVTQGYKFILDNIEIYKNLAKQEYQNYKEYIEKFDIDIDKDNIGIVDTGSLFKTSQKIISLFLGKENIIGYYWRLFENIVYQSNQYKAKSFEKKEKSKILDWNLTEFLITSPEPPIKNIVDSKPVYSIPSKYEQKRIKIYEYISEGIVEFSKIAKNCFWELETFIG